MSGESLEIHLFVCFIYSVMSVHDGYVLCVSGKRFPSSATCLLRDREIGPLKDCALNEPFS